MFINYLKILPAKIGNGTFTTIDIPANTPIFEIMGGPLYSLSELPDWNDPAILQIGKDTFMGPVGGLPGADYLNHSCNPNCRLHIIGNRIILYSMYVIKADSELTFDYSTTSTDTLDMWKMDCQCGLFNCRKTISGYQYLDDKTKTDMLKKNMIPMFMTNTIFR